MYNIFLDMIPPTSTSQENKTAVVNGRVMHFKTKAAQKALADLTAALKPFTPPEPFDGPIRLICCWKFPRGKGHKENEWRITRPDTDNLQKGLKDVMTRLGYWVDDSRVCVEIVSKIWSDHPGIDISIQPIGSAVRGED